MNTITPQQLKICRERGTAVRLFDVRTPAEFCEVHVPFAENRPLESFDPADVAGDCNGAHDVAIYVICQKGGRGANACAKLAAAGLDGVVNVEGGTEAWVQAGLPVVRGKQTISLERQVRIAAGTLVLSARCWATSCIRISSALAAFIGAGTYVCRSHGHLRNGDAARADAVESTFRGTACMRHAPGRHE